MKVIYRELSLIITGMVIVYFVPIISYKLSFPFYFFEPMRWFVMLAIAHSVKRSAYSIAIILPIFSFLIANHPSLAKTVLLSGDLLLNTFLFFYLIKIISNKFFAMCISITVSKIAYYLLKLISIELSIIDGGLISTPLYYQAAIVILLSAYVYFLDNVKMIKN